jgi:RNA polymerase sigma-70 factor (ECF subfamily)
VTSEGINVGDFEQIFDEHYPMVRAVARAILRNQEDVEDVVQEAFLDVHRYLHTFDESKGTFKNWVRSCAAHRAYARYRKNRRLTEHFENKVIDVEAPDRTMKENIGKWLLSLNDKQRLVIQKYFFEDKDLHRIAEESGMHWGTTRNHLYRGIANLKRNIAGEKA